MTRKEILRILDWPERGVDWSESGLLARVMRVAKAAAAAEREACAKVAEEVGNRDANTHAYDAAAAIRARSKT